MQLVIRVIAAVLILVETYYFGFRRGYDKGRIEGLDEAIKILEGVMKDHE